MEATDDTPTEYPNPGMGYGYRTSPTYQMGRRETYGPPWPPEAVRNGTKPIPREVRTAAQNRVRAYLAARADLPDGILPDDHIHGIVPKEGPGADLYASDLLTLLGPDVWAGDGPPPDTEIAHRDIGTEPWEVHESFGYASVNNTQSTGTALFGSDILHQHYVTLRIGRNLRRRDLHHDWYHGSEELVEVAFSAAQWGEFVSSFGQGSGVPCTITRTTDQGLVPGAPHAPRLAHSTAEVKAAADKALADITDAVDELLTAFNDNAGRKVMRELVDNVARLAGQAPGNMVFATKSLDEHVERVVRGAAADIEAMVNDRARQLGIDPGVVLHGLSPVAAQPALEAGEAEEVAPND